jgi:hypothetical protein
LRYFLAYHNAKKMGYSCAAISEPRVITSKPVIGLEGATVWLVAGEGETPKRYFLASKFVIEKCQPDKHPGKKLCNEVSGGGVLLGTSVCLDALPLLDQIKRLSANFVNGFFELRDSKAIAALKALA